MKRLIAGIAFVAATSVSYAEPLGGGILGSAWVYLPTESVISNNNAVGKSTGYVLNVSVVNQDAHTLAIGKGEGGDAYCLDESGAFKGGKVLDLSEPVADASGQAWTIVLFKKNCFWKDDAPFRTFVAPKELAAIDSKVFGYSLTTEETVEATFDCPCLTKINNGTSEKKFVKLNFKVPHCVEIESYALTRLMGVDVSEWDFSGVQSVGQAALPSWEGGALTGTLKLPSLRKLAKEVFSNAKYTRMEWGNRHNTLTSVGTNAINNNVSCEEIVIGCAEGCTFDKASVGASSLSRVWMTGAVPVFTTDDVVFGTSGMAEKSMVFYVPDTDEWATIRANATALTEEEKAAFATAHPTWDVPFGVVAANVFRTQNAQYIGTANLATLGVYQYASVGNRSAGQYGDSVSITVDGEEVTTGDMPYGSTVTVTATPKDSATVVTWEGKLPDGTIPTGNSFAYTATAGAAFYAVFTHPWEYDADAATISDGCWTLSVTADESKKTLVITGLASGNAGKGELNLSGRVYSKGDTATTWTITKVDQKAFSKDDKVMSFYSPTTGFVEWGSQVFNEATAVTNAVLNCPDITGAALFVWGYEFNRCSLDRLVMNVPNATKIGNDGNQNGILSYATMASSDLDEWDLSSLAFITKYGLQAGAATGVGPKGDLVLPNVETICQNAFANWKRVESAALGTNGTLKTLGATIFANNTSALKKLDFGTSHDFTTETTTFCADATTPLPVEEVWFADEAPSAETLDDILALRTVGDDGTKPVKIYAPMMKASWQALCRAFTSDERTAARAIKKETGHRVVGVYQTQAGARVAWLMQNPGFPYTTGTLFIFR